MANIGGNWFGLVKLPRGDKVIYKYGIEWYYHPENMPRIYLILKEVKIKNENI